MGDVNRVIVKITQWFVFRLVFGRVAHIDRYIDSAPVKLKDLNSNLRLKFGLNTVKFMIVYSFVRQFSLDCLDRIQ